LITFDRRIFKDRRKQPTLALSRFAVKGQRRNFRRKEDRQTGGYVDRYGSGLLFLIVLIVGLNVMDALLTMMILEQGGWEMNPIVRSVIQIYGDKFWIWKFAIVSVPLVLLCLHSKFRLATPMILGVGIIYVAAILFQIFLMIS
jgi:hypothetical protein